MARKGSAGDLELDQDLDFQRRDWRFQRAGQLALLAAILAALMGLFGRGPVAHASAVGQADAWRVRYSRFVRHRAPDRIEVQLTGAGAGTHRRLWLDRDYLDWTDVQRVVPEPAAVVAERDRVVYSFDGAPERITFEILPERVGRSRTRLGVGDDPPVVLTQFVFP
jgi:hypothetical protein